MIETLKSCFLVSFIVLFIFNAIHWRRRSKEQFTYFPTTGLLATTLFVLSIAMSVLALLYLFRVVPADSVMVVGLPYFVILEVYSIWRRQRSRIHPAQ